MATLVRLQWVALLAPTFVLLSQPEGQLSLRPCSLSFIKERRGIEELVCAVVASKSVIAGQAARLEAREEFVFLPNRWETVLCPHCYFSF